MALADRLAPAPEPVGEMDVSPDGVEFKQVKSLVPLTTAGDWRHVFENFNLDPEKFDIVGDTVRYKAWQQSKRTESGDRDIITLYSCGARFKRKALTGDREVGKLVRRARSMKVTPEFSDGDAAFVFAVGDLQLGKVDGDGTEGIVRRFYSSLEAAVAEAGRHRGEFARVHLPWLGDCVEGHVSQGGRLATRQDLTLTEQIDLLENLMLDQVRAFAGLAPRVTVVSVPGNHDETTRQFATRGDDSHAVQALRSVTKAIRFNPGFDHVETHLPGPDELTVTLDVAGTRIVHAHGHQWRPGKHFDWWSGQAFGRHDAEQADVLLAGHLHHFTVDSSGARRFIRVPSFEAESTWWRHRTGEVGDPGGVTFLTAGGRVRGVSVT